jgi:hypothetical protein
MIGHLDRKLLRDLKRLKGQAASVSLVMACGLAMLIMARSLIQSLDDTRAEYYRTNRFAEVFASLKRAPNNLTAQIAALPGVAGVQTDIAGQVTLDLPGLDEPASGLVRSLPDFGEPELNRLYLRRGRWLSPGSRGELLVGEAFAVANQLEPGDTLTLLLNGRRQRFQIAGIVLSPEYIFESRPGAALPDNRTYGIFWMPYKEVATAWVSRCSTSMPEPVRCQCSPAATSTGRSSTFQVVRVPLSCSDRRTASVTVTSSSRDAARATPRTSRPAPGTARTAPPGPPRRGREGGDPSPASTSAAAAAGSTPDTTACCIRSNRSTSSTVYRRWPPALRADAVSPYLEPHIRTVDGATPRRPATSPTDICSTVR